MHRLPLKQVAADQGHRVGIPALALAQIEDQGIHIGEEVHRRDSRLPCAPFRAVEVADLDQPDIPRQPLHPRDAVIALAGDRLDLSELLLILQQRAMVLRQWILMVAHPQVLVIGDRLHVLGDGVSQELPLVDIGIHARCQMLFQRLADLLRHLREDVFLPQQLRNDLQEFSGQI